ncbi:MAG TPA: nitroreductase [Pseudonocardia sp.]
MADHGGVDLLDVLRERRSRPTLTGPGPDRDAVHELLGAAASAPDHGRLRPWRVVVVEDAARHGLGEAMAAAHAERDPAAGPVELARTRGKALRAPVIVVVVAVPRPHPTVPVREQRDTAVCVAHGLVLAAHARGLGAMWRTGWFGDAPKVRAHLGLADGEDVVGFVYLGTPAGPPPPPRPAAPLPLTWLG